MNAPLDFPLGGVWPPSESRSEGPAEYLRRLQGRIFLVFAKKGEFTRQALSEWKVKMKVNPSDGYTAHVSDPFYPKDRILAWSYHPIFENGEEFLLFHEKQYMHDFLGKQKPEKVRLMRIRFCYRSNEVNAEREILVTNP